MKIILYMFIFILWLTSLIITISDLVKGNYFKEFDNIKSLNNRIEYMEEELLLIQKTFDSNKGTRDNIRFEIEVKLITDNNKRLRMSIGFADYVDFGLKYQPLYKSKLTGDFFLKEAPIKYYKGKYRKFYFLIFLKIIFLLTLIYFIIYYKNKL